MRPRDRSPQASEEWIVGWLGGWPVSLRMIGLDAPNDAPPENADHD